MSRRERQRAELHELCRSGSVGRALDLASAHFADYGVDEHLLEVLVDAVERSGATVAVRRRLAQLKERA